MNCTNCGHSLEIDASLRSLQDRGQLSTRLKVAQDLLLLLSQQNSISLVLCEDCAMELANTLETKLEGLKNELEEYKKTEKISREVVGDQRKRYEDAIEVVLDLEKEIELQSMEWEELVAKEKELDIEAEKYWKEMNLLEGDIQTHQEELGSVNLQYDLAQERLETLTKTNVYSDAFKIWHDGPFGLRLGRLPSKMVEWVEINAGMGQAALLLETVANKIGFVFSDYSIIPMGSNSRIEKKDGDKAVLELYGSTDVFSGMLFSNRRFDLGLTAFLSCLKQLGDFTEQKDPKFKLPYKINKDRIGDSSIRLQFNNDEEWTKALKYLLIDLKWMLAFSVS